MTSLTPTPRPAQPPLGALYRVPWTGAVVSLEYGYLFRGERFDLETLYLVTESEGGYRTVSRALPYDVASLHTILDEGEQWGYAVQLLEGGATYLQKLEDAALERQVQHTPLTRSSASDLHRVLGARVLDHYRFASDLLGRTIASFTQLTQVEAQRVERLALKTSLTAVAA